jgi:hypothetical protein
MQRAVRTPAYIAIGSTLFDKGIPYLEKAIRLGEERAHYTRAVIYIKRSEAKAYPENAVARMVSETRAEVRYVLIQADSP